MDRKEIGKEGHTSTCNCIHGGSGTANQHSYNFLISYKTDS